MEYYTNRQLEELLLTLSKLGQGGFGWIGYRPKQPDYVYKVSRDRFVCAEYKREFQNQLRANEIYKLYLKPRFGDQLAILRPLDFRVLDDGTCLFLMNRIEPLVGQDLTHIYLDEPSFQKTIPGRGTYLGRQELSSILGPIGLDLEQLAYYAGLLIGSVQFLSQQTGYDTELVIGRVDGQIKLFLIDFGLSQSYDPESISGETFYHLAFTLYAESYYPSEGPLHEAFRRGYLEMARMTGLEDLAERIIERWVE